MNNTSQTDLFTKQLDINHLNNSIGISGLEYQPNFLSINKSNLLLEEIDGMKWMVDLRRRVQHYGYKYDYNRRRVDKSMRIDDPPNYLQEISNKLKEKNIFDKTPDQVIINEYEPGQGISNHIDCEPCFEDTIASISLGSPCVMNFTNRDDKTVIKHCLLEPLSLVILKDEARYKWMHGIKPVKTDTYNSMKIKRERRISITFRKVILTV